MSNNKRRFYSFSDVKNIVESNGYILISKENEIVNRVGRVPTSTNIRVWCGKENHKYSYPELSKFIRGTRCRECRIDATRNSYDEVKNFIEDEGYLLVSKTYEKNHDNLEIICPKGHHFSMQYANFHQGQRCPKCGVAKRAYKRRENQDFVVDYLKSFGYTILSDFVKGKGKIEVLCPNGHKWTTTFSRFKEGLRCCHCFGNLKFEFDYVKSYIESVGFSLLSKEYVNCDTNLEIICPKGHHFSMSFYNFKNKGQRCPKCRASKGERSVSSFLIALQIPFISQCRFKDCKYKLPLPFDFYLPEYNLLIEYDGEQHFRPVERFGGFDAFIDTKIRDTIKNIYCKENNIPLLRIPYWEFDNIENILKQNLNL